MKSFLVLFLFRLVELSSGHINFMNDISKVVGYVGPACVVVDDLFYLHGHFIRRLVPEEVLAFKKYQNTLSLLRQLREAVSKGATLLNNGSISLPTPIIPEFCNGFDDSPEVILDGCTVRGNHVYIADRVVRPINLIEKQRINTILSSFLAPMRTRRDTTEAKKTDTEAKKSETTTTPKPEETTITTTQKSTQNPTSTEFPLFASKNIKDLISEALNVNANVTERFLPVAQMSPLFSHFMRRGEQIFESQNDDPRTSYYSPFSNIPSNMFFETLKTQKLVRPSVAANVNNTTTEIPHLFVDDRSMNAANQVAGGQLNPFDPLLIHLLQSLASRQQNVNEIVRQQKFVQQQLQQNQINQNQQPFILPPTSSQAIRAGETMLIGGQPYTAIQLNSDPNGISSIGLVPASSPSASNVHTVTALPPIISNWISNVPHTNHYGSNAAFNGYGIPMIQPQDTARYHHPGKKVEGPNVPLFVNGIPLPHDICLYSHS